MSDAPRAGQWLQRRWLARLVRSVVMVAPVTVTFGLTRLLAERVTASALGMNRWLWFVCLAVVSTNLLVVVDHLARRLLPLAALLRLALVFPDEAPSRFRVAMRSGTTRSLQRRLASLDDRSNDGEVGSAEYMAAMLEMVGAISRHERLTRGHVERVRAYTDLIIDEMGLGADEANKLRWAALLHDVGKLKVPSSILSKNGRPTDEEWELLKTHPAEGEALVEPLAPWLGDWRHAVGQHHERWDGEGYPRGLQGTDIHLSGRIVAVSDAYDVMTSTRSYKRPMSPTVARAEIARCAGTQFDPVVVRAFLNVNVRRLRLAFGPLSWLPNLPLGPATSVAPGASPVVTGLTALSAAAIGSLGVFGPPVFDSAVPSGPAAARVEVTASSGSSTTSPGSSVPPTTIGGTGPTSSATTTTTTVGSRAPTAGSLAVTTPEDQPLVVTLRASGGTGMLAFGLRGGPSHGTVELGAATADAAGFAIAASYRPDRDFNGADSFSFEACDDAQRCATASVAITVTPVNDPPVPEPKSLSVPRNGTGSLSIATLLAGAVDPEGDTITFVSIGAGTKGSVTVEAGQVVYRASFGEGGTDAARFVLQDTSGATATGVLTVTISGAPPAAVSDSLSVFPDATGILPVEANDVDPDGGSLRVVAATVATGTVTIFDGKLSYQPPAGFIGQTTGTYTIEDPDGMQASAQFTVSVGTPVAMYSGSVHGTGEDTLAGAVVWGSIWLYLETKWTGAQIAAVDFAIDGAFTRTDTSWTFDATDAPLDTTTLVNGVHRLTTTITLVGGGTITRDFDFTVAN